MGEVVYRHIMGSKSKDKKTKVNSFLFDAYGEMNPSLWIHFAHVTYLQKSADSTVQEKKQVSDGTPVDGKKAKKQSKKVIMSSFA